MKVESAGGPVAVTRDCAALTVPAGDRVTLSAGALVTVLQARGASVTVRTERGEMLRLGVADADAVGVEPEGRTVAIHGTEFSMDQVSDALRTVYDPEIPIDVVELGLIYRCDELIDDQGHRTVDIDLSMTAPGCGMGDVLRDEVEQVVTRIPGVDAAQVTLVWDPPWDFSRLSDAARLQLGLL